MEPMGTAESKREIIIWVGYGFGGIGRGTDCKAAPVVAFILVESSL